MITTLKPVQETVEEFLCREKGWLVLNSKNSEGFRNYVSGCLVQPDWLAAKEGKAWWVSVKIQETGYLSGRRGFVMTQAEFDSWKDLQQRSKTPVRFVFLDSESGTLYSALLADLDQELISYKHELSSEKPKAYLPLSVFIKLCDNFGGAN